MPYLRISFFLKIVMAVVFLCAPVRAQLIFDDPLTGGTTIGIRDNGQGQFTGEGWKVTSPS